MRNVFTCFTFNIITRILMNKRAFIKDEHKYEKHKSSKKDFIDLMLELLDGVPKGEDMVKAAITELVSAGTETSATTLEWTFAEILHHAPHVLTKTQVELDTVVGCSRLVDKAVLPRLPYLQAIIKEAFQLHPPVPLLVPHMSI
ncbi:hypothetical protein SELMODRAFT_422266 [Selaginella moellendorffii]|uniref:Cytochrome P450-dependent monooxygenase n=1 Tax=Selaginella moellendorffii TaxID=88036 RepID=D8SHW9_SELML|nr:hypothetical protein SELMODRAFT_422266 [Selaginella moellendorffii]